MGRRIGWKSRRRKTSRKIRDRKMRAKTRNRSTRRNHEGNGDKRPGRREIEARWGETGRVEAVAGYKRRK